MPMRNIRPPEARGAPVRCPGRGGEAGRPRREEGRRGRPPPLRRSTGRPVPRACGGGGPCLRREPRRSFVVRGGVTCGWQAEGRGRLCVGGGGGNAGARMMAVTHVGGRGGGGRLPVVRCGRRRTAACRNSY